MHTRVNYVYAKIHDSYHRVVSWRPGVIYTDSGQSFSTLRVSDVQMLWKSIHKVFKNVFSTASDVLRFVMRWTVDCLERAPNPFGLISAKIRSLTRRGKPLYPNLRCKKPEDATEDHAPIPPNADRSEGASTSSSVSGETEYLPADDRDQETGSAPIRGDECHAVRPPNVYHQATVRDVFLKTCQTYPFLRPVLYYHSDESIGLVREAVSSLLHDVVSDDDVRQYRETMPPVNFKAWASLNRREHVQKFHEITNQGTGAPPVRMWRSRSDGDLRGVSREEPIRAGGLTYESEQEHDRLKENIRHSIDNGKFSFTPDTDGEHKITSTVPPIEYQLSEQKYQSHEQITALKNYFDHLFELRAKSDLKLKDMKRVQEVKRQRPRWSFA